jgi:drug/metabolite transporter (DMT)-like permease
LLLLIGAGSNGGVRADRRLLLTIVVGGLFFAADLGSWHSGILRTTLANATLFGNASSFFFPVYGFIVLRQSPRPVQAGALLLALVGTALLLSRSYELSPEHFVGDLLALLAGLFYTFYLIAIERARRTMAPMPVLALSTLASILPLALAAWALGERLLPHDWLPLILLSLGSQLIGQGLLVYAVGHVRPLAVGIGLLSQPVVTALIGAIVYHEMLGAAEIGGAMLIGTAIVAIRLPPPLESTPPATHVSGIGEPND